MVASGCYTDEKARDSYHVPDVGARNATTVIRNEQRMTSTHRKKAATGEQRGEGERCERRIVLVFSLSSIPIDLVEHLR